MFRKMITYKDFNGIERTDPFYFHLNEAELMDIELDYGGNMSEAMKLMLEKHDVKGLLGIIAKLVRQAYGEKSGDGKRFMKNKEITDSFVTTEAYSALLIEMLNDENSLSEFMTKIMPSDMQSTLEQKLKERADEKGTSPDLKVIEKEAKEEGPVMG